MKIDVSKYDIEVLDVEGIWCGLEDVISLDYTTTIIYAGNEPIRCMVESVQIDCIVDGQITAMVYKPERVNLIRRC